MNGKLKLALSTLLTILPGVLVTLLSNVLPMEDAPLWMSQMGNGFFYMILGGPVILAVLNIFCLFITEKTNKDRNDKVKDLLYWLIPSISFVISYFFAAYLFGFADNTEKLMLILFAVMFIMIGNYLPKCKKNTTVGIKVKWTLQNNRNWEATHRFCGRLWVVGGFIMAIFAFLPGNIGVYVFVTLTLILAFVPFLYSYLFYRNQIKNGTYKKEGSSPKVSKGLQIFSIICVAAIVVGVCILLFTGHIEYKFRNHYVTVESSFFADMDLQYQDIDEIELVDHKISGIRVMGLGTARLACGSFRNDEIGDFTSYRYIGTDNGIIITTKKGETLVLSAKDEEATVELYNELLNRM